MPTIIKYGQTKVGGRHPQRLGDGGLRLQRQSQERPHRRRHGAQRNREAAADLALDIAQRAWGSRERFKREMMTLADAVQLATAIGRDKRRKPIILADVADNPGGGGRGNTTYPVARTEGGAGAGRVFRRVQRRGTRGTRRMRWAKARSSTRPFNTQEHQEFSLPFDCEPRW